MIKANQPLFTISGKNLVEFRARMREIKEKSILSGGRLRPDRTAVSGFTAYGCRVPLAGKNSHLLASVEFLPQRGKNYARSRGAVPSVKKA